MSLTAAIRDQRSIGNQLVSCALGISASDFEPSRGRIAAQVYQCVDFVEYGGYNPPRDDPGVKSYQKLFPARRIGRHLVDTELLHSPLTRSDVARIRRDLRDVNVEYLVTDFGFWHLGPRSAANIFFRACELSGSAAKRIGRNVHYIQDELSLPLFLENPFSMYYEGQLDMTAFLNELANHRVSLCLDIGHLIAACLNSGRSFSNAFRRLPFEAIQMCHIAGLSKIRYGGQGFLLDNHNVPPGPTALECLSRLRKRASLKRVVYEAELAPTDVQLAGLQKLGRI